MKTRTLVAAGALLTLAGVVLLVWFLPAKAALPPVKPGPSNSTFNAEGVVVERKDGTQILMTEVSTINLAGKWWVVGKSIASTTPKPDTFLDTRHWVPVEDVRGMGEIAAKGRFETALKTIHEKENK
jgi:hypothetical protein